MQSQFAASQAKSKYLRVNVFRKRKYALRKENKNSSNSCYSYSFCLSLSAYL